MRTTVTIDDKLYAEAAEFSNIKDKSKLINFALDSYIKKMAARRLVALGGTMPDLVVPGRGSDAGYEVGDRPAQKVAESPE
ncbi:MAG: type II toxin-antitoxin system VapB family antitoxin [Verrucomicrobiales bacterium]|nr:type II toxin-antitoxin system VapB family antitoxin [Verrucomicrobiota bacterium JB025]